MIAQLIHEALFITGFVAIMMLLVEYINVLTQGAWQKSLVDSRVTQYLVAVLLGATPGCLGAFAVVAMYSHGVLRLGALVAAMIATSGDEAFVMFAMFPGKALLLMAALIAIGLIAGWLTDNLAGRWITNRIDSCKNLEIHIAESCKCFPGHDIFQQLRELSLARGVLMGVLLLFLFGVTSGTVGPESWNWIRVTILITGLIGLFIVTTVPEHFLQEHLWRHVALKHVHQVFLWTLGALVITWIITNHLDLTNIIQDNTLSMIIIAGLVGIIPESGPHLVFTTLYAKGAIPLVVLLTNSIVQDGHGMLPLLAHSRTQFLFVKAVNLVFGLATGLAVYYVIR
ncbi:MAG: arsenic efflux protein [candidate division Zixibacteria bacterium]|nr:arsenic efflux protein [candidate division Zixibacteria bacterium]